MDQLSRNSHHVFYLHYHFVWIPKYRHKVFSEPYRTALKSIIRQTAYNYDMEVTEIEIPPDHIHMTLKALPRQSPSEIMRTIKSISAREFFSLYPDIQRQHFWGGKLWTESYFVETVGRKTEEAIRKYVQDQLKEMDRIEQQLKFC
jgi:putative transposase